MHKLYSFSEDLVEQDYPAMKTRLESALRTLNTWEVGRECPQDIEHMGGR